MSKEQQSQEPGANQPPDYPEQTVGSQLAREARQKANNLTEEQREELFRRGMSMIYGGGTSKERVGSR
jgi:hypothetical protein